MTDKELLELAAKAAGINWQSYHMSRGLCLSDPKGGMVITQMWNPLTDDGDALQLTVKLRLTVAFDRFDDDDYATATPPYTHQGYDCIVDQDPCAATRRAITRAAAAIGKTLI
jgi:hypothetical protein